MDIVKEFTSSHQHAFHLDHKIALIGRDKKKLKDDFRKALEDLEDALCTFMKFEENDILIENERTLTPISPELHENYADIVKRNKAPVLPKIKNEKTPYSNMTPDELRKIDPTTVDKEYVWEVYKFKFHRTMKPADILDNTTGLFIYRDTRPKPYRHKNSDPASNGFFYTDVDKDGNKVPHYPLVYFGKFQQWDMSHINDH